MSRENLQKHIISKLNKNIKIVLAVSLMAIIAVLGFMLLSQHIYCSGEGVDCDANDVGYKGTVIPRVKTNVNVNKYDDMSFSIYLLIKKYDKYPDKSSYKKYIMYPMIKLPQYKDFYHMFLKRGASSEWVSNFTVEQNGDKLDYEFRNFSKYDNSKYYSEHGWYVDVKDKDGNDIDIGDELYFSFSKYNYDNFGEPVVNSSSSAFSIEVNFNADLIATAIKNDGIAGYKLTEGKFVKDNKKYTSCKFSLTLDSKNDDGDVGAEIGEVNIDDETNEVEGSTPKSRKEKMTEYIKGLNYDEEKTTALVWETDILKGGKKWSEISPLYAYTKTNNKWKRHEWDWKNEDLSEAIYVPNDDIADADALIIFNKDHELLYAYDKYKHPHPKYLGFDIPPSSGKIILTPTKDMIQANLDSDLKSNIEKEIDSLPRYYVVEILADEDITVKIGKTFGTYDVLPNMGETKIGIENRYILFESDRSTTGSKSLAKTEIKFSVEKSEHNIDYDTKQHSLRELDEEKPFTLDFRMPYIILPKIKVVYEHNNNKPVEGAGIEVSHGKFNKVISTTTDENGIDTVSDDRKIDMMDDVTYRIVVKKDSCEDYIQEFQREQIIKLIDEEAHFVKLILPEVVEDIQFSWAEFYNERSDKKITNTTGGVFKILNASGDVIMRSSIERDGTASLSRFSISNHDLPITVEIEGLSEYEKVKKLTFDKLDAFKNKINGGLKIYLTPTGRGLLLLVNASKNWDNFSAVRSAIDEVFNGNVDKIESKYNYMGFGKIKDSSILIEGKPSEDKIKKMVKILYDIIPTSSGVVPNDMFIFGNKHKFTLTNSGNWDVVIISPYNRVAMWNILTGEEEDKIDVTKNFLKQNKINLYFIEDRTKAEWSESTEYPIETLATKDGFYSITSDKTDKSAIRDDVKDDVIKYLNIILGSE